NVPTSQLSQFLLAAQLSLIAYDTNNNNIQASLNELGFTLVTAVNNGSCYAFIANIPQSISQKLGVPQQVLAIQGTEFVPNDRNIWEVWADLSILPSFLSVENFIYVHSGIYYPFYDIWDQLSGLINPTQDLWIVGHSLGGVRAQLARWLLPKEMNVRITTFGAPRGANSNFWDNVSSGSNGG